MASPVAVGGFSQPRPATKDEQSSLGKIWHLALQHHPALNHDYGKTSISSVSSQVVNGTNLAYVVQSDGEAHRIVAHFPGPWDTGASPQVLSAEKL